MPQTPAILLVATPLEDEHVARLRALAPDRLQVLHDRALLPTPRFPGDHHGAPFARTPEQQARWQSMLARATVLFGLPGTDDMPFLSHLAWVQATGTGVGPAVRRLGLDRLGVLVTTARGVHGGPLAEWVFMALLSHLRGLGHLHSEQAYRRWEHFSADDLAGRTLLLVGAGELARACARVARAFDMRVVALARDPARHRPHDALFDAIMPATELHLALGLADAVVMAAPHTAETVRMMDAAAFAACRPGALFVNVGHGETVDTQALVAALRSRQIGFAALDVTDPEPLPPESPLWSMPNVLISPHSASTVRRENARLMAVLTANLHQWLESRHAEMRNVLDTSLLY